MLFKHSDIALSGVTGEYVKQGSFLARHFVRNVALVKNIEDALTPLPKENESIHFISHGKANAFTFILFFISKFEKIDWLTVAMYRIGSKTIETLMELLDKGGIGGCTFVINDNIERIKPEIFKLITEESASRDNIELGMVDVHAKVFCIYAGGEYWVIEGSGNFNNNARIEQYVIVNSKTVYDFHSEWIHKVVKKEWDEYRTAKRA